MHKTVLMLDEYSRANITANVYMLNQNDVKIIVDLAELIDLKYKEPINLIVLEGLLLTRPYVVSTLEVYRNLLPINIFYLGKDEFWLETMKSVAIVSKCDYFKLSWEMIQGVLYQDSSFAEQVFADSVLDTTATAIKLLSKPDTDAETTQMAMYHLNMMEQIEIGRKQIRELSSVVSKLQNQNNILDTQNKSLLDGYKELILESKKLNDTLQQYEIKMTQQFYNKTDLYTYNNRPLVIYLKEYQELVGLDMLIETLVDTLELQRRKSVKVLRLLDNAGAMKLKAVPNYYKVIGNQYEMQDIFVPDFLCKTGDSSRVIQKLLENKTNLDILIVVDCTSWGEVSIVGDTLFFGLCRDSKLLDAYNLSLVNTFVNDKGSDLFWDPAEPKTDDAQLKFEILSNRECVQKFLKFVDMYE